MKNPMFQPCADLAVKLAATHPDDLSSAEWDELAAHIALCPTCAAIRAEYRLMDDRIRNYPADKALYHSSTPPPIPGQFAGTEIGPLLPMLDRVHGKLLRNPLYCYVPLLTTFSRLQRMRVVILIIIVCLIASLFLSIYFLKTNGLGF